MSRKDGLPTGPGTAPRRLDVADPHPSDEEHHDRARHPGSRGPHTPPVAEVDKTQAGKGDAGRRNTGSA